MQIRFSDDAQKFVAREAQYLRSHSSAAARRFLDRIREARRNLSLFPHMGPEATDPAARNGRRLVIGDYVLTYDIMDDLIAVLSIRHSRMMSPDIAEDPDDEATSDAS